MNFYTVQFFSAQNNAYFTANKSTIKADLLSLNDGGRRSKAQMNQDPVT